MNAKRKYLFGYCMLILVVLLLAPLPAVSQEHGSGGGGGCGDVFGDLIHILRNDYGQPILAQRWVELPAEAPGYGWGYCPIAVSSEGEELGFLPYSCDIDPLDADKIVEVNYFGRLNGGRTKERNNRMHLDEVISNIKAGHLVKPGPVGRLMIGFDCRLKSNGKGYGPPCEEWTSVDSPMESMGLYTRVMKYGHLATDPYEVDSWAHGDPKFPTQFHPALSEDDWPKFHNSLRNLLPNNGEDPEDCWGDPVEVFVDTYEEGVVLAGDGVWFAGEPFSDMDEDCVWDDGEPYSDLDFDGVFDPAEEIENDNGNCVYDEFVFMCAGAEPLENLDFISGSVVLAAAASKTGYGTEDLFQFANRILKIAKKTEHTVATHDTLPALYRDCWDSDVVPFPADEEPEFHDVDVDYDDECNVEEPYIPSPAEVGYCDFGTPNHCLFPDLQERFVDFSGLNDYQREGEKVDLIRNTDAITWEFTERVDLGVWVEAVNGTTYPRANIAGFDAAFNDALRSIEYIHNYAIPANLHCLYETNLCANPE